MVVNRTHQGVAISLIAVASILGALSGTQMYDFLETACVMRGECYGREDWVYVASLIPIQLQTIAMVAAWLVVISLFSFVLFPLRLLHTMSLMQSVNLSSLRRTSVLVGLSGLMLLILAFGLSVYIAKAW